MSNGLVDFNLEDFYDETLGGKTGGEEKGAIEAEILDGTDDFERMILAGTRQESRTVDANLPRYGVALLHDIPLIDSNPYFFMGDFNIKNDPRNAGKGNARNVSFFPRLKLYPFVSQEVPIPFESAAHLLTEEEAEEEQGEAFNVATVESTLRNSRKKHFLTAERFALQIYERYKEQGFVLLDALTGIESYAEANQIFERVLTRQMILEAIPQMPRERFGFRLNPPFVPDIVEFLENGLLRIERLDASQKEKQGMQQMRVQLLAGARIARTYCDNVLSNTEARIAAKEKKNYDMPNFTHQDAKPPRDLVAMIHLNRQPRDMKALEIAQMTGQAMAAGMSASAQPRQLPVALSEPKVTEADVDQIVKDRLDRQQKSFDEQFKAQSEQFDGAMRELRDQFLANQNPPVPNGEPAANNLPAENAETKTGKTKTK